MMFKRLRRLESEKGGYFSVYIHWMLAQWGRFDVYCRYQLVCYAYLKSNRDRSDSFWFMVFISTLFSVGLVGIVWDLQIGCWPFGLSLWIWLCYPIEYLNVDCLFDCFDCLKSPTVLSDRVYSHFKKKKVWLEIKSDDRQRERVTAPTVTRIVLGQNTTFIWRQLIMLLSFLCMINYWHCQHCIFNLSFSSKVSSFQYWNMLFGSELCSCSSS